MTNYKSNFKTDRIGLSETHDILTGFGEIRNFDFTKMTGEYHFETEDLYDAAILLRDLTDEVNANSGYGALEFEKPSRKRKS